MIKKLHKRASASLPTLLWLMLLALLPAQLSAADGDTFEYTYEGKTVKYTVISEVEKTVKTFEKEGYYGNYLSGDLILPEKVLNGSTEYTLIELGRSAFYGLKSVVIPNSVTYIGYGAFAGCEDLESAILSNSLTSIGEYIFSGCSKLTSINIPESVIEIAEGAFYNCSGLTSIDIPESVTSIGEYAFYGCSGLTSIDIPNSVTSIGGSAFSNCSKLTKVTIGDSVTTIGRDAFSDCSKLTKVTIGNSVTEIGSYAFEGCSGLTSVDIPNSVTTIGRDAFSNCSELTKVTIGDSVTEIGSGAFEGCSGLTSVDIPNSVTTIGSEAFRNCTGLTKVTIGDSVTEIGSGAFEGCSGLTSIDIPNSVTTIGSGAFKGCSGLTSIDIPNSVTTIGSGAFKGCSGLTSIDIPNSVTSIGESAFYNCSGLTNVTIGNSVTEIGIRAFEGCSGLTSVDIPNSVTEIDYYAFSGCTALTEVTIGNSVTTIGQCVFNGCSSLTSVVIPNSVTYIGYEAFNGCSSLTSVTIPNSVTSIGIRAFNGCSSLTSVNIPNSVTSIGSEAFKGCRLTCIALPNSVTTVGDNAFSGCPLKKVAYPSSIDNPFGNYIGNIISYNPQGSFTYEDGCFWSDDTFYFAPLDYEGDYTIPSTVKYIGSNAFNGCTGLTSVEIPNSVTSIRFCAFKNCTGLTSVNIPNSVSSIGEEAFYYCSKLKEVAIPNSVTSIGDYPFSSANLDKIAYPSRLDRKMDYINAPIKIKYSSGSPTVYEDGILRNEDYTEIYFASLNLAGEYTIPASVTMIRAEAFKGCKDLTSIVAESLEAPAMQQSSFDVLDNQPSIYDNCTLYVKDDAVENYLANYSWILFKNIKCPAGDITRADNGNFKYATNPANQSAVLLGPAKSMTDATILAKVKLDNTMYDVTSIARNAFKETNLSSVTFREGIKTICDSAFYSNALTSVEFPASLTTIKNGAFQRNKIKSITFGENLTSIGECAFRSNQLKEVVIPDAVITIGNSAFRANGNLTSVKLGASLESIGDYAFYYSDINEEIILPEKLKTIGYSAFALERGTRYIDNLTIPASVTHIDSWAFGNIKFSNLKINDSTEPLYIGNIGNGAFRAYIGRNITGTPIGSVVEFGNLVTEIMSWNKDITSVTFGSGIKTIPANAFNGAELYRVVIPSNVTSIGENAFKDNRISQITIGCGTTEIGANAFAGNNDIATINVTAVEPPVATDDVFSTQNAQLNVLEESRSAYENADCWYQFEGISLVPVAVLEILKEDTPASRADLADNQIKFSVKVEPADASLKEYIFWESSNPAVATVNGKGVVTFTGATEGTADIIARSLYADAVASCTVTADGEIQLGIDDIIGDGASDSVRPNDIYNLQGVCLKRNASQADVDALAPGLYIVGGKKVLVK